MLLAPALVAAPTSLLNPLRRSVSTTAVASASLNLSQNMAVAHGPLVSTVEDGRTLARDVEPLLVSRSAGSLAPRVGVSVSRLVRADPGAPPGSREWAWAPVRDPQRVSAPERTRFGAASVPHSGGRTNRLQPYHVVQGKPGTGFGRLLDYRSNVVALGGHRG